MLSYNLEDFSLTKIDLFDCGTVLANQRSIFAQNCTQLFGGTLLNTKEIKAETGGLSRVPVAEPVESVRRPRGFSLNGDPFPPRGRC